MKSDGSITDLWGTPFLIGWCSFYDWAVDIYFLGLSATTFLLSTSEKV